MRKAAPGKTPEGTCQKCGRKYYGWALAQERERKCACGGKIGSPAPERRCAAKDVLGRENASQSGLNADLYNEPVRRGSWVGRLAPGMSRFRA